jgi:hypothetical protein
MLLYDVTYPAGRTCDKNVPWTYLERLAGNRRHGGAVATCVNGAAATYRLEDGRWVDGPLNQKGSER